MLVTDERLRADISFNAEVRAHDKARRASPTYKVQEWHAIEETRIVLIDP